MPNYKTSQYHEAPGPEITVRTYRPGKSTPSTTVRGIIDTGAVLTGIPKTSLKELGKVTRYGLRKVQGPVGSVKEVETWFVDLKVGRCRFPNIEVIPIATDYALIGRDIIRQYRIILDGPNSKWGFYETRNDD